MNKKQSIEQLPKKRIRLNDFDRFIDFSMGTIFSEENHNNKIHVVDSLIKRGELLLLQGDIHGNQFFDLAAKLSPSDATLFYQMGLSLFEFGSEKGNEKTLLLACKRFKKAVRLNPHFFEAWQAWGNALYLLGTTFKEHHYFLKAKEIFAKAIQKSKDKSPDILADLHWENAVLWTQLAFHSGEILDWHIALDSFETAAFYQEYLSPDFWQDFGKAALQLGKQINDIRFYLKAINCYKNAVSISLSSFNAWFLLAETLKELYLISHDEDHFSQANECYMTSVGLNPYDSNLWVSWASVLLESGKRLDDTKRLRAAIEKCHRATTCSSANEDVIAIWSEALAFLGLSTDRIELIHRGQEKIAQQFEAGFKTPKICYAYGMCLFTLGKYYNELDYYFQAIEKFQEGLSINRSFAKLWYALGHTYVICGELENDATSLEKACRFYHRAINLQSDSIYFYDYALALSRLGEMTHHQKTLELSAHYFEKALMLQKNAIYLHPHWLFHYATTLDMLGDFADEDAYYMKAIEILNHVLMVDPEFPEIHHQLALVYGHLGELIGEIDPLHQALHHYRLAAKREEENDQILLDWGLALIHLGEIHKHTSEAIPCFNEAEYKLTQSARLGNVNAYYYLGCLYSLLDQKEKAMYFIEKAHQFEALPSIEEILDDEWLDDIKETDQFKQFLIIIESKPNLQEDIN